jgi:DNA-binding Xre family transcriptional regulator
MKCNELNIYELNTLKLRVELAKIEKNQTWLADQIGVSRQYVAQLIKNKRLSRVEDFARVLKIEVRDLIRARLPF